MQALVRRPSSQLADGIVTHIDRSPVDMDLAYSQWENYVAILAAHGWEAIEVEPLESCPDSVFIEDTMVLFDKTAVITRPGADERKPETVEAEKTIADAGYAVVRIEAPGTLDGGDVLKVGRTVYVGRGGRTNGEGIKQLRAALVPLGATVIGLPLTKVLHLKTAVTALPDGTIIGYAPLVDDVSMFPHFLPVPEEAGSHVVLLGDDRLLISADAPQTTELLTSLGWTMVPVDISEYEKLEGCVTCLSVRMRGSA